MENYELRKLKINLEQLIVYLTEMKENGAVDIYIYEHNGLPALCDVEEEDNYIIFSTGTEDDDGLH